MKVINVGMGKCGKFQLRLSKLIFTFFVFVFVFLGICLFLLPVVFVVVSLCCLEVV